MEMERNTQIQMQNKTESVLRKRVSQIVNLTRHEIVLGDIIIPSVPGQCVRCAEKKELIEVIEYDGREIEAYRYSFGGVSSVPPRQDGTIYIASYPVARTMQRDDVYCMGEVVRDSEGRILGAMCLSKFFDGGDE